jgi:hypothetical protein
VEFESQQDLKLFSDHPKFAKFVDDLATESKKKRVEEHCVQLKVGLVTFTFCYDNKENTLKCHRENLNSKKK